MTAKEVCAAAKADGNAAYQANNLQEAVDRYTSALASWEEAFQEVLRPKVFAKGACVRYNAARKEGYGTVESAFPVMDEYFLRDLGTGQAIWVGDVGGDLQRFSREELRTVPQDLFDLRFACAQNLAAVCLKQEDFAEAVRWADEALKMNGKAPKALMRKGAALLKGGHPGPASEILKVAAAEVPKDLEVKKLLQESEKTRPGNWVCMNGCCGPGFSVCSTVQIGTGSLFQSGPKVPQGAVDDDSDSDSDCSTCSGNNDQECSKLTTSQQDSADASEQSLEPTSNTTDEESVERTMAEERPCPEELTGTTDTKAAAPEAECGLSAAEEEPAHLQAAAPMPVPAVTRGEEQGLDVAPEPAPALEPVLESTPISATVPPDAMETPEAAEPVAVDPEGDSHQARSVASNASVPVPSKSAQLQCALAASVLALAMAAGLLLGHSSGFQEVMGV